MSSYLKDRRKNLAGYTLVVVVFAVVNALYQMHHFSRIMYAVLLTGFIVGCYGIYDYLKYRAHYQSIHRMGVKTGEELCMMEDLPQPDNILQEEYQKRIMELQRAFQNSLSEQGRRESERMDYYLMWAHQIKTPIAAMKLMIQNGSADPFLMEKELFKIESYVEMVLHYLRLESISSDLLLRKQDVYTMVKQAVKKYSLLFIGHRTVLHLEEFRTEIVTDEKWFTFVIEQCLSNAVKYTPAGEISVYMKGTRLILADTGIGIREEDIPRIFERGFTGYNGRMDKQSTGLGLYLCRQITKRLGISLEIHSRQGQGTKVELDFAGLYSGPDDVVSPQLARD